MAADLVILDARIFTGDAAQPFAQALAVAGERVAAVGRSDEIRTLVGPGTRVIRHPGALCVPGFNDAHTHALEGGEGLAGLDLRDAQDEAELRERVAAHARTLPAGAWIVHGGWDHERWPSKRWPTRELIDDVSAGHPALLTRVDGHLGLANSVALVRAGITRVTPDPPGGAIARDGRGEPTGILVDTALAAMLPLVAAATGPELRRRYLEAALVHAARLGVTSLQDNVEPATYDGWAELHAAGRLTARVSAWYPIAERARLAAAGVRAGAGDRWLRRGTVKVYTDGSMGAGSAWFWAPYADDPGTAGLAIHPEDELWQLVSQADVMGLDVACHAIGDRANAVALDTFATVIAQNPPRSRRHRIEHAQAVRPADLGRYRDVGLVVSLQPVHVLDDLRWLEKRLGRERGPTIHRLRSLVDTGAAVAFGTDWYVAPLDPRRTLFAAVAREAPEGGPAWFPAERLTLAEALAAYTTGSAFAEGLEGEKGRLAPGYLADLCVLARDLFTLPPREWLEVPIALTVVGGRVVYEAA